MYYRDCHSFYRRKIFYFKKPFLIIYGNKPFVTSSMVNAARDLKLDRVFVIHRGSESRILAENIEAVPVTQLLDLCARLRNK